MRKLVLVVVGLVFTGLALLGAVLPGLPTTPFLIVALWAFARSSRRLTLWLERVPILQSALRDAQRFEERRELRLTVKLAAIALAWGSVLFVAWWKRSLTEPLVGVMVLGAIAGTVTMILIPTDREPR
ncbi:MAG TPA: YbaN family protein [Steroidobacteraceae bacterium]|nr:YbaN family protein [Steroidobacteraceae bacterium]HNS27894.1 YbaN family protein [Steroidobacteraceae bacterium]